MNACHSNNDELQKISHVLRVKHGFAVNWPPMLSRNVALQRVPAVEDLVAVRTEHAARLHVPRFDVFGQVCGEARPVRADRALEQHVSVFVSDAQRVSPDKVLAA